MQRTVNNERITELKTQSDSRHYGGFTKSTFHHSETLVTSTSSSFSWSGDTGYSAPETTNTCLAANSCAPECLCLRARVASQPLKISLCLAWVHRGSMLVFRHRLYEWSIPQDTWQHSGRGRGTTRASEPWWSCGTLSFRGADLGQGTCAQLS